MNTFSRKRNQRIDKIKKEYPNLTANEKMDICIKCDKFSPTTSRCQQCGCFMKMKVYVKGLHCPLDKW